MFLSILFLYTYQGRVNAVKQSSRWLYRITIFVLTVGIIYQGLALFHGIKEQRVSSSYPFPYESFAYISVELRVNPTNDTAEPIEISSKGSGMVVGTTIAGNSAVLTANHVCNPPPFLIAVWNSGAEKRISVTDFNGNVYEARVILSDIKDDLCLLEIEGSNELYIGEKVYSVAAPMAFFSPGMVPLLDGYYSGDIWSSNGIDSVYTVPAREGSSGSVILNADGEIVGVVHSSLTGFQSVTICSTQTQVRAFLAEFEYVLSGILSH